jgi:hypothetical protein
MRKLLQTVVEFRPPLPISVGPVGAPYAFTKRGIHPPGHAGLARFLTPGTQTWACRTVISRHRHGTRQLGLRGWRGTRIRWRGRRAPLTADEPPVPISVTGAYQE